VEPLLHAVLAVTKFAGLLGVLERFVFEVKKLLNDIKDLKTVKREAQNRRNRTTLP
jgi:hypothetical protein